MEQLPYYTKGEVAHNITYQLGQSFDLDFTIIVNPSCRRFYPLLVFECVRTKDVMTSLGDVKLFLPTL